jgi:RNA polymerase sigma factor (sigma-70 family)
MERLKQGDLAARDALIRHAGAQLERLTRKMLKDFPGVKRWVETDDVFQSAALRLLRALQAVSPPSTSDFFRLAAEIIRRELIDLARRFQGPQGIGANHDSRGGEESGNAPIDPADFSGEPTRLLGWTEFHAQVDSLPEDERDVMNLLFYQGLKQAEAAELLGVSVRTVQNRWRSALLKLHEVLKDQWPDE